MAGDLLTNGLNQSPPPQDKSVDQKNIRHKKGMKFALIVELEQLNFINITIAKKHLANHFSFGSI